MCATYLSDGVEIFVNGDCTLTNFLQYIAERMNQNGVTLNQEECRHNIKIL